MLEIILTATALDLIVFLLVFSQKLKRKKNKRKIFILV